MLNVYATTLSEAGTSVNSAAIWPSASVIGRAEGHTNVVVFAHPDCPCTQATLSNLRGLKLKHPDAFQVSIVFFELDAHSDTWAHTRLKKMANNIPGAELLLDLDGKESQRFGVQTSGHVLVYGRDGGLSFSGGITSSRGHEGASPGLDAIEALLGEDFQMLPAKAEIFGCPLGCKS